MSEFDFDKEVATAQLEAAGWGMDAFNHGNPFESHFLYVRDYRNDHTRLFTIKQSDFEVINLPLHMTPELLAGVVADLMLSAADGKLNVKDEKRIVPGLVGYAKATETYRSWRRVSAIDERLHLVINIYPHHGHVGFLRPLILRTPNIVLTAAEVLMYSAQVRDIDERKHPEWFGR
ncbi:hypothetical protein [Marinobacterium aestuariivivens]|uniref:Uncharacterized protein n=1 Tax=Marinobacterium aestuariivivens TaxID=1698799 RepID=A0ABW2AA89_9GAMM